MAVRPPTERVEFANTLRGLAAMSVLIQHYFVGFWSVPGTIGTLLNAPPLPVQVPAGLGWIAPPDPLSWGSFGVGLFFLVSGFVIPFSLAKLPAAGFLVGRLFRILPVYAVGFTITLFALWVVGAYFSTSRPLSATQILLHYLPGLRDLSGTPSLDAVVWTLDIEVKFYVICALGAPLFRAMSRRVLLLPLIVATASILATAALPVVHDQPDLRALVEALSVDLAHIVYMFIGTAFYMLYEGRLGRTAAAGAIVAMLLGYAFTLLIGPTPGELLYAVNYVLAVGVFAVAMALPRLFGSNSVTSFFASISYPLYTVHAILGWTVLRILCDRGMPAWLSLLIATSLAIGLAWLLHRTIEAPFHRLGRTLSRQVGRMPPRAAVQGTSSV